MESVRAGSTRVVGWQEAMKSAVRDPARLCELLSLPLAFEERARQAAESFPLFAPLEFIRRMQIGDPSDPLLRQVLPVGDELTSVDGYSSDPVGDTSAALTPSLLKKYHGRALLITTGACAIHCRYCFRRHYPYTESPPAFEQWQRAIAHIQNDPSINEILLSGGEICVGLIYSRVCQLLLDAITSIAA